MSALERLVQDLDDAEMEALEVIAGRPCGLAGISGSEFRPEPESCLDHIRKALEMARAYQGSR